MKTTLQNLPEELLLEISDGLNRFDLLSLSQACRALYQLSISSTLYWGENYVPAFLPVIMPQHRLTAAHLRAAAVRSERTRRALMENKPQTTKKVKINGINFHHTLGSRFLFQYDLVNICCWDGWTGKRIGFTPLNSAIRGGYSYRTKKMASLYRSSNEILLSIVYEKQDETEDEDGNYARKYTLLVERFVVTIQNRTRETKAMFRSEGFTTIWSGLEETSVNFCQLNGQYLAIYYHGRFVRILDWSHPKRQSYIYCPNTYVPEMICTASHIIFFEAPSDEKDRVYIRPIPLGKWFEDDRSTTQEPNSLDSAPSAVGNSFHKAAGLIEVGQAFRDEYPGYNMAISGKTTYNSITVGGTDSLLTCGGQMRQAMSLTDILTYTVVIQRPDCSDDNLTIEYHIISITLGGNQQGHIQEVEQALRNLKDSPSYLGVKGVPQLFLNYNLDQGAGYYPFRISKTLGITHDDRAPGFDAEAGMVIKQNINNAEILWYS